MVLLAVLLSVNKASMRLDWKSVKKALVLKAHFYFLSSFSSPPYCILQSWSIIKLNSNMKSTHTRLMTEQKEGTVLHRNNAMQYFTVNIKKGSMGFLIILLLCKTYMTFFFKWNTKVTFIRIRNLAECPLFSCLQLYFNWSFIWNFGQCF